LRRKKNVADRKIIQKRIKKPNMKWIVVENKIHIRRK